jgi:hypothetical protein
MLKRVVIVTNSDQHPIANSMARAFSYLGGETELFINNLQ